MRADVLKEILKDVPGYYEVETLIPRDAPLGGMIEVRDVFASTGLNRVFILPNTMKASEEDE